MLWAVVRLVSTYLALRFNFRDAGLDYRATEFLHAVEDVRLRLVRTYWVRVKEARTRLRTNDLLDDSTNDPDGGQHHQHSSRLPQPARSTHCSRHWLRWRLQRAQRDSHPDPTNPNGPPAAA